MRDESIPGSQGRILQVGELLPAMAIKTPTKPVSFADRHLWARKPVNQGGRGGYLLGTKDPKTGEYVPGSRKGVKFGETGKVAGVNGVPADQATVGGAWDSSVGGGNAEYELGRRPLLLAMKGLGKRRTPTPRFTLGRDGMGG